MPSLNIEKRKPKNILHLISIFTRLSTVKTNPTDVDLQFLLFTVSEDIHLGGVDGVEDEGDQQGQQEGRPASDEKVSDGAEGNLLVTDL